MTRHRQYLLTRRILCWMAIAFPLMALRIDAQEQPRGGTITGIVRDSSSLPISGADIMLRKPVSVAGVARALADAAALDRRGDRAAAA